MMMTTIKTRYLRSLTLTIKNIHRSRKIKKAIY